MTQLRQLGPPGCFFEAPRWHDGEWWVSDFYDHVVTAVDVDGRSRKIVEVPGQPSGLGWSPDGRLLVVAMRDRRVLRWDGVELTVHADLQGMSPGFLNDMLVTSTGFAYVGNFGFDLERPGEVTSSTALVMVRPDGSAQVVADDLYFPNACIITPDARTLIVNETLASRHTAFGINVDGTLSGRYVWAQVAPPPPNLEEALVGLQYAPDGGCIDAEARLWAADAVNGRVVLVMAGGDILREIPVPDGLEAFACCLGGPDGRTLLVAVAPDYDASARSARRESLLLTTQVEVPRSGYQD